MQGYYLLPVKRAKKHASDEHHGGMWKVAYADFVTAMMAFFLLLWLIDVTTPEQKKGLAAYFTPTIGLKDSMGIGFRGGRKPSLDPGQAANDLTAPGLVVGQLAQGPIPAPPDAHPKNPDPDAESTSNDQKAKEDGTDNEHFKNTAQEIKQELERDLKVYKNDVVIQDTLEGLKIDIIDDAKKPMFLPDSATLTDGGKKILDSMANIIAKTPNNITINGHTAAGSDTTNPQYTNWELSSDRAHAARRFLITTQVERERVVKIVGFADRDPLEADDPASARNRRITIILMRGSYYRDPHAAPKARDLISVSDARAKKHSAGEDGFIPAGN